MPPPVNPRRQSVGALQPALPEHAGGSGASASPAPSRHPTSVAATQLTTNAVAAPSAQHSAPTFTEQPPWLCADAAPAHASGVPVDDNVPPAVTSQHAASGGVASSAAAGALRQWTPASIASRRGSVEDLDPFMLMLAQPDFLGAVPPMDGSLSPTAISAMYPWSPPLLPFGDSIDSFFFTEPSDAFHGASADDAYNDSLAPQAKRARYEAEGQDDAEIEHASPEDGLIEKALQTAADLKQGAHAVLKSSFNRIVATLGFGADDASVTVSHAPAAVAASGGQSHFTLHSTHPLQRVHAQPPASVGASDGTPGPAPSVAVGGAYRGRAGSGGGLNSVTANAAANAAAAAAAAVAAAAAAAAASHKSATSIALTSGGGTASSGNDVHARSGATTSAARARASSSLAAAAASAGRGTTASAAVQGSARAAAAVLASTASTGHASVSSDSKGSRRSSAKVDLAALLEATGQPFTLPSVPPRTGHTTASIASASSGAYAGSVHASDAAASVGSAPSSAGTKRKRGAPADASATVTPSGHSAPSAPSALAGDAGAGAGASMQPGARRRRGRDPVPLPSAPTAVCLSGGDAHPPTAVLQAGSMPPGAAATSAVGAASVTDVETHVQTAAACVGTGSHTSGADRVGVGNAGPQALAPAVAKLGAALTAPAGSAFSTHGSSVGGVPVRPTAHKAVELQRQIDLLQAENTTLRSQLRASTSNVPFLNAAQEQDRIKQLQTIFEMLDQGASESQLRRAILQYKDMHSDFGRDRWNALRYHLRCLRYLLLPTHVTKMCMFSVGHDDVDTASPSPDAAPQAHDAGPAPPAAHAGDSTNAGCSNDGVNSTGRSTPAAAAAGVAAGATTAAATAAGLPSSQSVWQQIVDTVGITPEQERRIMTLRDIFRERRREFAEVLTLLKAMEEKVGSNFQNLEFQMNLLMSHISARQTALFLRWMEARHPLKLLQTGRAHENAAGPAVEPATAPADEGESCNRGDGPSAVATAGGGAPHASQPPPEAQPLVTTSSSEAATRMQAISARSVAACSRSFDAVAEDVAARVAAAAAVVAGSLAPTAATAAAAVATTSSSSSSSSNATSAGGSSAAKAVGDPTAAIVNATAVRARMTRASARRDSFDHSFSYVTQPNLELPNHNLGPSPSPVSKAVTAGAESLSSSQLPSVQSAALSMLRSIAPISSILPQGWTSSLPSLSLNFMTSRFGGNAETQLPVAVQPPGLSASVLAAGDAHVLDAAGAPLLSRGDGVDGNSGSARSPRTATARRRSSLRSAATAAKRQIFADGGHVDSSSPSSTFNDSSTVSSDLDADE